MARKKASDAPVMEVMVAPETEAPVKEEKKPEPAFSKQKLVGSKRFKNRRDALSAILKDDQKYTIAECEELLNNFMKGKV